MEIFGSQSKLEHFQLPQNPVFFSNQDKKHKLPRYCLHCCFVDVREPWLCLLGMIKSAPPTATVDQFTKARRAGGEVQIEAM